MEKPVSQVLEEAAEALERDGWCQYSLTNHVGQHCMLGALDQVGSFSETKEAGTYLRDYVGNGSLGNWNDAPGRTQQEVLDAFISAAKQLRNEGR